MVNKAVFGDYCDTPYFTSPSTKSLCTRKSLAFEDAREVLAAIANHPVGHFRVALLRSKRIQERLRTPC